MNISEIIALVKKHKIDAVHPGYGFLSESPEFAQRVSDEAGAIVIGPGWKILSQTGDKLQARKLAVECQVPVLAALQCPTDDIEVLKSFASSNSFPIVVKAVDGGGGRGIRIIRKDQDLPSLAKRALEESPTKKVFAEAAAVDGFRHIEVQIIGDGRGNVRHLWERECSIQRRFQKIVEFAPSSLKDRSLITKIIDSSIRMARKVNYLSLGTFEFLVSPTASTFYFLECNPRLQVEHTVTESISFMDLVKMQLLVAQGCPLTSLDISDLPRNPQTLPPLHSLQIRITAENPSANWSLSVGKINSFSFPSGNGIRVDTSMLSSQPTIVGTEFDSLLAKLVITSTTWGAVVSKAKRALEDTRIDGITTNLAALRGIISHPDFLGQGCDTRWLENNLQTILEKGSSISNMLSSRVSLTSPKIPSIVSNNIIAASSNIPFRKGDAWKISLAPKTSGKTSGSAVASHLQLTRVLRNDFPESLSADIIFTPPSSSPQPYSLTLEATSASSSTLSRSANQRRGDSNNPNHIIIPFPGQLMEILIEEGDWVKKDDIVAIVRQMKMELEIRSDGSGQVVWVFEGEDGEVEVGEGVLLAEIDGIDGGAKL